ncbi:MAG: hypothetical protein PHP28_10180 [Actinomycetota bacterium]|nr:hypothetical protein [Actinomycetota bacterium]
MNGKVMLSRLRSEDGQVWSIALKILLVVIVLGAIIIQAGPVIWNHISIRGTADDAADEAVMTYRSSRGNMQEVEKAVRKLLDAREARLYTEITFIKGKNGEQDMIGISVRKIVNTYFFEKVGYLCRYTEAVAYSERPIY